MKDFKPEVLRRLYRPDSDSHKGQNGRLLVIGGSKLFHASIFWSANVASKIVDLVHFSSPENENNDLVRYQLKQGCWEGIVVPFEDIEKYIEEDDCVLIGPGMPRDEGLQEGERPTGEIVNGLLEKYPNKRWVVDGGALQEVRVNLLNGNMIITPHEGEWERLLSKNDEILRFSSGTNPTRSTSTNVKTTAGKQDDEDDLVSLSSSSISAKEVSEFSVKYGGVTVLLKGKEDLVCRGEDCTRVAGGNAGMTKGGTGDVLAGLVAALYCKNEALLAAQAASYINKKAGAEFYERVGFNFNASDLVNQIPRTMKSLV